MTCAMFTKILIITILTKKVLIVFDDMINSIVAKLFIRGRKLNISLVFITQSYFKVPKDVALNTTHFLFSKIPNRREL